MASHEEKKKGGRPKGLPKTGGRQKGTPNKLGTTISEVFRNILGLDDDAVERTKKIDGEGYGARIRLQEMISGKRDPDPAWTGLLRVCLSYGYGNPRTMEPDQAGAMMRRLAFITARGLPWQEDPLALRESQMLQQQETEAALQLEVAKKQEAEAANPAAAPEGEEEALQLVRSFDLKEPR
jgi:hypothetical protein